MLIKQVVANFTSFKNADLHRFRPTYSFYQNTLNHVLPILKIDIAKKCAAGNSTAHQFINPMIFVKLQIAHHWRKGSSP